MNADKDAMVVILYTPGNFGQQQELLPEISNLKLGYANHISCSLAVKIVHQLNQMHLLAQQLVTHHIPQTLLLMLKINTLEKLIILLLITQH